MKKIAALFFLLLMLHSVALVHAQEEPNFITCRACKTVQTFSIVFGIYFGIILSIHTSRWYLAAGNAHRRMEVREYVFTTLKILGSVFLFLYIVSWVSGMFGVVILSPHETMRGCEAVCLV